jgi:hypothetical protein
VDFFCRELNLAVDVDGSVHDHQREQDERRHKEIEALGVAHLRFWNYEVKNDMKSVLQRIADWIREEETRRGWPRGEEPVFVPRSRATRAGRRGGKMNSGEPTPDPSQEGNRLKGMRTSKLMRER